MANNIDKKIFKDQELFFNLKSQAPNKFKQNKIFVDYDNKEQLKLFKWLEKSRTILDYGCGNGDSINYILGKRNHSKYTIYGVDIAKSAIKIARKKYPKYKFYKIVNNKIPQIKNNSLDGVILSHVLHHTHDHQSIFKEIYLKLKKKGHFLIIDLSSNNLLIRFSRSVFLFSPTIIKNRFSDDLVIDGKIPEKYKVNIKVTEKKLQKIGFKIVEVGYSNLFFFVFEWLDKFIPFSKLKVMVFLYKKLISFEDFLLKFGFFKRSAELFYIKCIKS